MTMIMDYVEEENEDDNDDVNPTSNVRVDTSLSSSLTGDFDSATSNSQCSLSTHRKSKHLEDAEKYWNILPIVDNEFTEPPVILMQCEDFGGNLVTPWRGHDRPGLDYYVANLNVYATLPRS